MSTTSKTKIIRLPGIDLKIRKQGPPSTLMMATLLQAYKKQLKGIPFGQADIHGPFSALVARGLLKYKSNKMKNREDSTWTVTNEAIEILGSRKFKHC